MTAHEEETQRPPLLNLLIGVTLATIVIALWYLIDYYYLRESADTVTWYPPAHGCVLLDDVCRANLGVDASLSFSLQQATDSGGPLTFEVRVYGERVQAVHVSFVGRDINVRSHRFALYSRGDGVFVGQGDMGRCSRHVEDWRAQVTVLGEHGLRGTWFDFDNEDLQGVMEERASENDDCLWTERTQREAPERR